MTRKTGKAAVKARQQMRAAKQAKYKRELAEAGVKLSLPKPSAAERKQKEEELKRLYLELFPKKAEEEREEQAEQPAEEQPEQKEAEGGQQEQPEQPQAEQKEQAEGQDQAEGAQEKQGEQSD